MKKYILHLALYLTLGAGIFLLGNDVTRQWLLRQAHLYSENNDKYIIRFYAQTPRGEAVSMSVSKQGIYLEPGQEDQISLHLLSLQPEVSSQTQTVHLDWEITPMEVEPLLTVSLPKEQKEYILGGHENFELPVVIKLSAGQKPTIDTLNITFKAFTTSSEKHIDSR